MSAEQLIRDFKRTGEMPEVPTERVVDGETGAIAPEPIAPTSDKGDRASFELTWQKTFQDTGHQLRRLSQFSSPELIRRLQEALEALAVPNVQHAILPGTKYSSYSLGARAGGPHLYCLDRRWQPDFFLQRDEGL